MERKEAMVFPRSVLSVGAMLFWKGRTEKVPAPASEPRVVTGRPARRRTGMARTRK
jgi:hypothetical protein